MATVQAELAYLHSNKAMLDSVRIAKDQASIPIFLGKLD
jgi:hypothetical protein